ncbi:MAG: nitrous oxide reductase family maturation protein NosD [Rhizobiaceae bacterium]
MIARAISFLFPLLFAAVSAIAAEIAVEPGGANLARAIATAEPGDILLLGAGIHGGDIVIDRSIALRGDGDAEVRGNGTGTVITVDAPNVTISGLVVTGSGSDHQTLDSGIKLTKKARNAVVENNIVRGNLHGIDIHGARDAVVRGNAITGRSDHRMNDRGNGIYVWNAPGSIVENNNVRLGRDGIFVNTSRRNIFRDNRFEKLRFAIHYMYANDSEVSGNVSVGNHLGYALMFSSRLRIVGNASVDDRDHGIMLNYANNAQISGNLVLGGGEKCLFMYNANKNRLSGNRFEGCPIGIHFTAGSERNTLVGNAFIANRTQVKYVGSKHHEWSDGSRGNYWSDHAAYDVNGDGIADQPYRPNDLIDQVLWTQPVAKLLLGSPAIQLVRWAQREFPALLPGGVVDTFPLMHPAPLSQPLETLERGHS